MPLLLGGGLDLNNYIGKLVGQRKRKDDRRAKTSRLKKTDTVQGKHPKIAPSIHAYQCYHYILTNQITQKNTKKKTNGKKRNKTG